MFFKKTEINLDNQISSQYLDNVGKNFKKKILGLDENGNLPLVMERLKLPPKEKKIKEIVAAEKGFEKTANDNIYYDKEKNLYLRWNEGKQKFIKDKYIVKIYPNGCFERLDEAKIISKIYESQGNDLGVKSQEIMEEILGLEELDSSWIAREWGFYFHLRYDPNENKYYNWDEEKKEFVLSEITDIAGDRYFAKNDKYFKAGYGHEPDVEITKEEFYSKKQESKSPETKDK